jgi:hypothetical protein
MSTIIGLDLAEHVFQVRGVDDGGSHCSGSGFGDLTTERRLACLEATGAADRPRPPRLNRGAFLFGKKIASWCKDQFLREVSSAASYSAHFPRIKHKTANMNIRVEPELVEKIDVGVPSSPYHRVDPRRSSI